MKIHISHDQKEVLKTILLTGGVIALAVAAPNAARLIEPLLKPKRDDAKQINYRRLLASLARQGFVQIEADTVTLTRDGLGYTQILVSVEEYRVPSKWDGKWRMVCFDIPESHKSARRFLRDNLKQLGFWHLQKSVYFFPYDSLSVIQQIVDHFAIARFVTFGVVESLENSSNLERHFSLRSPHPKP